MSEHQILWYRFSGDNGLVCSVGVPRDEPEALRELGLARHSMTELIYPSPAELRRARPGEQKE